MQNVAFKNTELLLMTLQTMEHATWWVNGEQSSATFTFTAMQHNHMSLCFSLGAGLNFKNRASYIQGVTGGRDKTSGECSLC